MNVKSIPHEKLKVGDIINVRFFKGGLVDCEGGETVKIIEFQSTGIKVTPVITPINHLYSSITYLHKRKREDNYLLWMGKVVTLRYPL